MEKGILYFIWQGPKQSAEQTYEDQFKLAIRSAASVKEQLGDIHTTLFTNLKGLESIPEIDNLVEYDSPFLDRNGKPDIWEYKYQCLLQSPYDITLHMDADTYACADFSEVFDVMDQFDLAIPLSVTYLSRPYTVPVCFPEPAGGFMLWKKNEKTKKFLEETKALVEKRTGGCDEPFIRIALYYSDVRYAILPWEYNCLYIHPGYLFGEVKIMHGRRDSIVEDAKIMNTKAYKEFPPWKRLHTGNKLLLFKKKKQKLQEIVEEIDYQNGGNIRA